MTRSIAIALVALLLFIAVCASAQQTPPLSGSNGEVHVSSPPSPHGTAGVFVLAKPGTPDVLAKLGAASATTEFTIFDSADLPLFSVTGDRKIGIGTRTPAEAFHLIKDGAALARLRIDNANTAGGTALHFSDGTAGRAELASYGSLNALTASRNTLQLWNYAGGAMIFGLNDPASTATNKNFERMRITPSGNIGIGLNNPTHRLHVNNTTNAVAAVFAGSTTTAEGPQSDLAATAYAYQNVPAGIVNPGSVAGLKVRGYLNGPGHVDDTYGITVETGINNAPVNTGTVTRARGIMVNMGTSPGVIQAGYGFYVSSIIANEAMGLYIADLAGTNASFGVFQNGANDKNFFAGHVGIGVKPTRALDVVGDAHFTGTVTGGNIQAKYQDVAEWVPATEDLSPGTVVVLNTARNNEVMRSGHPYDTRVAGVVSAQPGLSLGVAGEGKELIATTGRVKVRVDARQTPIAVGDLLVTGELAGTAIRSIPLKIDGRQLHQPGTIIGKALEPLSGGIGEILVLLSMQ
ncbi:MAG TPA: hypothetical protein VEK79_01170 [Thermoanaerobaculia bacterium]|nr:hypothetical protein [Thermoanaerobaculia bacterium]